MLLGFGQNFVADPEAEVAISQTHLSNLGLPKLLVLGSFGGT